MRIKAIILSLSLVLSCLVGQAQNNVFDNLDKRTDIETVHLSKSLLGMVSKMETGTADIASLADKLKQIDSYTSETDEAAQYMSTQANSFAKNKAYETFMTVKEKTQTTVFYGQKSGDKFQELIMVITAEKSCKIMRFVGEFTAKDIQGVIKKED